MGDIADDLLDGLFCGDNKPLKRTPAIKLPPKRKNHKFDVWDECERCGVTRQKVSDVGDGFNGSMINKFHYEYSSDNINFSKEFINCNTK